MFSLYPYYRYLRNWREGEGTSRGAGVLCISSDGDDRRILGFDILDFGIFGGRKIWQAFFFGGLI